ncbi:hypothetical protein NQ318_021553 [Aromia moschata]|uniref:Tc1-like transposase DDE domain-containing protein n=1 Tax=Aromia moschata TaxID=1265417 RepID=A0AAV8YKQ4_9CUCU|nr:hypothetical protein NQ318_021553 [Aromia moschata]
MLNSTQNAYFPIILRSQIFTNGCGNLVNLKREVLTLAVTEKSELKLWKKTYGLCTTEHQPILPVNWPARSSDLNPLDFCIWGYLKTLVYSSPVGNIDDL